jgi:hypothetical protein
MFDGGIMNFGSHVFDIFFTAVDYVLCVWRLHMLVITDVEMCGTLGLWMSNFLRSVFVLLKISSKGWILYSLTHKVATIAIQ